MKNSRDGKNTAPVFFHAENAAGMLEIETQLCYTVSVITYVRGAAMDHFKLVSDYKPTGDQPEAIDALVSGIENGIDEQVLLGVTGSGKTFTMANVIARLNRPTLVLAHNKTLAAQLCREFEESRDKDNFETARFFPYM